MTTTMNKSMTLKHSFNMFEYFHCMTQFIDELVEKHGYDREILTKTWQTKNAKWMKEAEDVVAAEPKPAAKKAAKAKVDKVVAAEEEKKPKGKGKKATVTPAEVHADDLANDEKTTCTHKFTSGKNNGTTCTKDAMTGTDKCKTHTKKDKDSKKSETESDTEKTEKPAKKAGKKAAKKTEEKTEPIATEEEEKTEPIATEEEKTEEPTSSKVDSLGEAIEIDVTNVTKCKHEYKTGKNKGETCTADAVEGTDKCKTHTPKSPPKTSPKDVEA